MAEAQNILHEILPVGVLQCNCHIVADMKSRDAIVIDPGDDPARILEILHRHHLKVSAIVITHAHIDHVMGLHRLKAATGAPVYMHSDDIALYRMLDVQASWIGWKIPEIVTIDHLLREGDSVRWGDFEARVLHTPGHTEGSISLYMPPDMPGTSVSAKDLKTAAANPGRLFAGDTLFAGSIGRTDLWGGSLQQIMRSIQGKLLELPDETLVFPGHGEQTSIGEEREHNPFLQRI